MTDPEIILEKFERDCGWNREKVRGRRKICDYRILIDGEHRGTYWQGARTDCYDLKEPSGEYVRQDRRVVSFRSNDIALSAREHLVAGIIPSLSDLEANAERRGEEALRRAEVAERERLGRLAEEAAPDLLAALEAILTPTGWRQLDAAGTGTHAAAWAAIRKATGATS